MKKYEELDFTDDFMFCKVLADNEEICRELLELILNIKIRKVAVKKQEAISITPDAKSVRFDVYAEDEDNTVFDVEMETTKKKNLPKRSRYYQGMIDLNIIQKGEDYKKLKKSYIIFICLKDPFDKGRHLYTFENRCIQQPELILGDETVKVFLNASGIQNDISPALADFLTYLTEKKGESTLVKRIDEEVKKARAHEEWKVEYMTLQMKFHDIYDDAFEEGALDQLQKLVKKNLLTLEDAAREAHMSVEEFRTWMKEMQEKSNELQNNKQ